MLQRIKSPTKVPKQRGNVLGGVPDKPRAEPGFRCTEGHLGAVPRTEFLTQYSLPLSSFHVMQDLVAARWQQLLQNGTLRIPSPTEKELFFPLRTHLSPELDTGRVS